MVDAIAPELPGSRCGSEKCERFMGPGPSQVDSSVASWRRTERS